MEKPDLKSTFVRTRTIAKKIIKQAVFEASVHTQRAREQSHAPRVVIFPSNQPWDASSHLRAWLVAPELRKLGWRVVVVPEPLSLAQRRRILRLERPDVVLMQQTRHSLNDPSLFAPWPCVLDADDADYLDPRHHERIVRCAEAAAAVVGGSRFVAEKLGRHNADATVIWTGTPHPAREPRIRPAHRGNIVAWGHATPLGYPHEAEFVHDVMLRLAERRPFEFWLFGTPPGAEADAYFAPLRARGTTCVALAPMPYEDYLNKIAEAAVGIMPVSLENEFSRGKSFGKVLAYLAGQTAVVAADAVDHPLFFRHGENGMLANDPGAWVDSIERLLADPEEREQMAKTAYREFRERLTTRAFAERLDVVLRRAAGFAPAASSPLPEIERAKARHAPSVV